MLTLGFAPVAAFADLLIEPGLAYRSGTYDGGTAATKGKVSGVGLNARLAYEFTIVFAGLDLGYSFGTATPDSGSSSDTTAVSVGPVVGASLPMLPLRFWLAYYMMDYATLKSTGTPAYDLINNGTAIKVGAGYTIIPLVSVNLDYVTHTYTKSEDKILGVTGDLNPNIKGTDIFLSVSVPLSL
jgi:hypothetical protein